MLEFPAPTWSENAQRELGARRNSKSNDYEADIVKRMVLAKKTLELPVGSLNILYFVEAGTSLYRVQSDFI